MRKMFGFTLIELLIVIAVIAILVGITVPRFLGMRDEANSAKASGETSALKAATEAYRIHKNKFPTVAAAWQGELISLKPQLIESALIDPFSTSGAEYKYDVDSTNKYYVIWSVGVDGTDDITAICTNGKFNTATIDDDIFATNGTGEAASGCTP